MTDITVFMRALHLLVAFVVTCSGCAAVTTTSPHPTDQNVLRSVIVSNEDYIEHTVDVVILRDDQAVYWTSRTLGPRGSWYVHSVDIAPPEIANTTDRYTVLVRLDNRTNGVKFRPETGMLGECYSIGAKIWENRLTGPVIHHWNDDLHDYCSTPSNESTTTNARLRAERAVRRSEIAR